MFAWMTTRISLYGIDLELEIGILIEKGYNKSYFVRKAWIKEKVVAGAVHPELRAWPVKTITSISQL